MGRRCLTRIDRGSAFRKPPDTDLRVRGRLSAGSYRKRKDCPARSARGLGLSKRMCRADQSEGVWRRCRMGVARLALAGQVYISSKGGRATPTDST